MRYRLMLSVMFCLWGLPLFAAEPALSEWNAKTESPTEHYRKHGDNCPAFQQTPEKYSASPTLLLHYLKGYRIAVRVAAMESRTLATDGNVPSAGEFHPSDDKRQAYTDGYNSGKAELCKAFHKLYTRLPHEFLEERPAIMQHLFRKAQGADTSALDQQKNHQPAPTRGLAGTPDWFALGEEVYHRSDIIAAQKKVLSFLKERRWFVRGDRPAPYPATISDVPATSEDASLDLTVTPTADPKVLQFTMLLTAKRRDLFRSYQHRENNVLPILFAFFSDGEAIKLAKDGFYTSVGGACSPDILVKSGKNKTWQVKAATQSLVALLPARSPQTISIVAAFSEFNHAEYPSPSMDFPGLAADDSAKREDPEAAPLVRSNIVQLRWDGKKWKNIAREAAPPAEK